MNHFKLPPLPSSWMEELAPEFEKEYMKKLLRFLDEEKAKGKIIYPEENEIFSAFELTPLKNVKVVIIGQDPYHGEGQAHGTSFSVKKGIKPPPSLVNIYKEIHHDLGFPIPLHGHLEYWARQGVLLLNAVLTVEKDKAASHQKKGWESFTDKVVELLNCRKEHLVFLLWGSHAQKKGEGIDRKRHLVLETVHPSPLSAHRGFLGCKHFSQTNTYLKETGQIEIDWKIP